MKGWQREYIKDIIKEGHYPTEEELRDIEVKCDLSRKQVRWRRFCSALAAHAAFRHLRSWAEMLGSLSLATM